MNGRFQSEITKLGIILQSNENKTLVSLNFSIIFIQTIMRMQNNLKYLYENVKYEMIIHSNDSISLISIVVLIFASIFSIIANSGLFIVIYVIFFKTKTKIDGRDAHYHYSVSFVCLGVSISNYNYILS